MSHNHNSKKRKLEADDCDESRYQPPTKKIKIEQISNVENESAIISTEDVMNALEEIFKTFEQ